MEDSTLHETPKCAFCGRLFHAYMRPPIFCCGVRQDNPGYTREIITPRPKDPTKTPAHGLVKYWPIYKQPPTHWIELHKYASEETTPIWDPADAEQWFGAWEGRIPEKSCGCSSSWRTYRDSADPVDFRTRESFFEWGVRAHNHVSTKHVNPPKLEMPLDDAYAIFFPRPSKILSDTTVLTSCFVGDEKSVMRQHRAIMSWRRHGAKIVSCNLRGEVSSVVDTFGEVLDEIAEVAGSGEAEFGRDKPSIMGMLEIASSLDGVGCIANSDVEVRAGIGYLEQIHQECQDSLMIGLRWNWLNDYWRSVEFQWGLDVFMAQPDMFYSIRKNIKNDFWSLGWPGWDYVLPISASKSGIPSRVCNGRLFFHEDHTITWSLTGPWQESLLDECRYNWHKYRLDLSPGLVYNERVGRWLTKDGSIPPFVGAESAIQLNEG